MEIEKILILRRKVQLEQIKTSYLWGSIPPRTRKKIKRETGLCCEAKSFQQTVLFQEILSKEPICVN